MLVTVPVIFLPIGNLVADVAPRIRLELLHAERDAVGFLVDADDLHLDRLADVEDLGRMVDAAPCHVGDMQQAVDAAEVDERTVVGDVLDHAFDHLAFFEVLHDLRALLGARLFKHGAARHDDVAAAAIHLEDLEGLRVVHEGRDVADRTDVDLAERGRKATAPSRSTVKPPLTWLKMTPSTRSPLLNFFEADPALSRRALSRDSIASPSAFSMRST